MKRVLAIVVTFNGARWIEKCLGSLAESSVVPDVFILDNASSDDTVNKAESFLAANGGIKATIIRSETNLGFAAANNEGLRYAVEKKYDFVYLLNQDAWLMTDTLEKLLAASKEYPEFGLLSPIQLNAAMTAPDANFAKHNRRIDRSKEVEVSKFFPAAHWLIPIWALKSVGAFSPAFHHYGEDDNWIDRLHYFGFKSGIVTSAKAVHDRENRCSTKEYRMHRKCLIPVIRLSSPSGVFWLKCCYAPVWLMLCGIKNKSLIPIKEIPALFGRMHEIKLSREQSRFKGAFLTRS